MSDQRKHSRARQPIAFAMSMMAYFTYAVPARPQQSPPLTIRSNGNMVLSEQRLFSGNGRNLIYFAHGFECEALDEYVSNNVGVHYFVRTLGASGKWDVIAANFRAKDCQGKPAAIQASEFIAKRYEELRAEGYQRIVMGGQSLGAWSTLIAAQADSFRPDVLLMIAPARWGRKINKNGRINSNFKKNTSDYLSLISKVKIPLVEVFFENDAFDPGGRDQESEDILQSHGVPYLDIDNPNGFSGHGSGWLPVFDYKYGACIGTFLLKPETSLCKKVALSDSDFRSAVSYDGRSRELLSDDGFQDLIGRKFLTYSASGGVQENTFLSNQEILISSGSNLPSKQPITFSHGMYCYEKKGEKYCRYMVSWSRDKLIAYDHEKGNATSWWIMENEK